MSRNKSPKTKAADTASTGNTKMNDKETEVVETPAAPVEGTETVVLADTQAAGEVETPTAEELPTEPSVETTASEAPTEPSAEDVAEAERLATEEAARVTAEADAEAARVAEETRVAEENRKAEEVREAEAAAQAQVQAPAPVVEEDNTPMFLKVQRIRLAEYVSKMGGQTRITDKEQLDQQNIFRLVIQGLLKLRGSDFVAALDDLLATINDNRGYAFKEKYVFRQYPNLPIAADERRLLVDVVTLLVHISDPGIRALAGNHVDLSSALKGVRDYDEVRALFHEYITR